MGTVPVIPRDGTRLQDPECCGIGAVTITKCRGRRLTRMYRGATTLPDNTPQRRLMGVGGETGESW